MPDLAVVGQDPRFGGGALAHMAAFWEAATALGRSPHLFHLAHPTLASRPWPLPTIQGTALAAAAGNVDSLNQLAAGIRLAPQLSGWRSLWVVSTLASHGYAAARSGRRYACWISTALADEHRGRRAGLPRSRRLALAVNAPLLRRLERATLRGAAAVYAMGADSRRAVAEAGGLSEKDVRVLPVPVDGDRFAPAPDEQWRAGLEAPTLVFVGRADDPRKNAGLLLEALPLIRSRLPAARVRLVGRPPAAPLPAGVEAVGEVAAVADELRRGSIFVLPSHQEGFGIVAAEALASGLPVLTTPSGGPEELVRASGGGRVLEGFSAEELAATATELLTDVGTLSAMRSRGREYVVREHSPARLREVLAAAFAELD